MTSTSATAPAKVAIRLTRLLDAALGETTRFPVNVVELAKAVGSELRLGDGIVEVAAANLKSFEGGLFRLSDRRWALLFNETLRSQGRIRFTQAHELGHFLVHRSLQDEFECSQADVAGRDAGRKAMEAEANEFASTLLIPVKQLRACIGTQISDFEVMSGVSERFGVSLTAACLRWIRSTGDSAVLVLSRDGYIDWSVSSATAFKNGAFIKTRGLVIPLPEGSLAARADKESSRQGECIPLRVWFKGAHADAVASELKLSCDNYGYTLTLLLLSPGDNVSNAGQRGA